MSDALPFTRDEMLARMLASDATADGHFLTGVISTSIYCLPSCPARKPKPKNVAFFATESAASAAGLRPCKRCRPDHFYAGIDPDRDRFNAAYEKLRSDPAEVPNVATFARFAGVSATTLYGLATRFGGATPGALIHASRIELAKRLLREEGADAIGTAFAVGYQSVSAFYVRFKRETGLTPATYARQAGPRR